MVIFSIGCSGSGKSFYGNTLKGKIENLEIICPDDVRAEMGDVSDQSHNKEVFSKIYQQLETAMKAEKNIYYSATNLTKKSRVLLMQLCKKYNQNVIAVVFLTSYRPDICEKRVRNDLNSGVNRSNTMVKTDKGKTIVQMQAEKFRQQMKNIENLKKELEENSKSYRIKYIECAAK